MYPMRSLACSFLMTAIRGPFLAFRWVVETANSKPVDLDWRATDKATWKNQDHLDSFNFNVRAIESILEAVR